MDVYEALCDIRQYFVVFEARDYIVLCTLKNSCVVKMSTLFHSKSVKKTTITSTQCLFHLKQDRLCKKTQLIIDRLDEVLSNKKSSVKQYFLDALFWIVDCLGFRDVGCYVDLIEELELLLCRDNMIDRIINKISQQQLMNNKAKLIQKQYRESISNPNYKLCRDRLVKEFESMNDSTQMIPPGAPTAL